MTNQLNFHLSLQIEPNLWETSYSRTLSANGDINNLWEIKKELSSSKTVIFQQQWNGDWMQIACASRALTATESRYAQIENEALAITWACEKFNDYVLGMKFHIQLTTNLYCPFLELETSTIYQLMIISKDFAWEWWNTTTQLLNMFQGRKLVIVNTLPTAEATTLGEQVYAHVPHQSLWISSSHVWPLKTN